MNQFYYIDANTDSVKLTTAPEKVETAYKNIFIENFKLAKEFLTYGYKSKYDLEWDMVEAPPFGLEIAHRTINQIKELDDEFRKFVKEYADYGYRLEDLETLENSFNDLHLQVEETQNNFKNYLDEINNKSIIEGNNLKLVVEGLETKLEEKQKEICFSKKGFYALGILFALIVVFLLFKGM